VSLSDWAGNGWLVQHGTSPKEIADLLGLADRDLHDCAAEGLSDDSDLRLPTMRPCNVGQLPWLRADIGPRAKRIIIVLFRACASRLGLIPGWSPN
jgi:hypothetical protein